MALPLSSTLALTVAGTRLLFRADDGLQLAAPGFQYPPFLEHRSCQRTVCVDVHGEEPPDPPASARLLLDTGDGWQLLGGERRRWLRMPRRSAAPGQDRHMSGPLPSRCLWQLHWREPLQDAEAFAGALVHRSTVRHLVQYPLDQVLLTHAMLDDGALLLHAAGGETPAGGVAFAGVSGAGKSTLSRLLGPVPGFDFLSDDRLFACPAPGGTFRIHGTPWAGDALVADPGSVPLGALCFLRQAVRTSLTPLRPGDALHRLLPVCTLPLYDAARMPSALQATEALLTRTPCYELAFNLDAGAVAAAVLGLRDAA